MISEIVSKMTQAVRQEELPNSRYYFVSQLKLLVPGHASSVSSCQWLYLITFGGGLVEGDNVSVDVKVGEHSTVVVTTQASTKVCIVTKSWNLTHDMYSTHRSVFSTCAALMYIRSVLTKKTFDLSTKLIR